MNNINWYVEILDMAPVDYNSNEYLKKVIDSSTPFMEYFFDKLLQVEDWSFVDAKDVFESIVSEMPVFNCKIIGDDIIFKYNKWVNLRLTDTAKQIYRDIKLEKILNTL